MCSFFFSNFRRVFSPPQKRVRAAIESLTRERDQFMDEKGKFRPVDKNASQELKERAEEIERENQAKKARKEKKPVDDLDSDDLLGASPKAKKNSDKSSDQDNSEDDGGDKPSQDDIDRLKRLLG